MFWFGYVILGMGLFLLGHYAGIRYIPEFVELVVARTLNLSKDYSDSEVEDDENVSFSMGDDSGLKESNGFLFIEDEVLQIEYQSQDSILGLFQC